MSPASTAEGSSDRRVRRFRRGRMLLFLVVAICLAQIAWWVVFQVRQSGIDFDLHRQIAELRTRLGETQANEEVARAADTAARRVRMAAAEGGFLVLAVLVGVVSIYWLLGREIHRQYEQNQLLAAVSHDFRSPLTAIRLLVQTFEMGRVAPEDRGRLTRSLVANVRRLEDLVENVLAAARFNAGRIGPPRDVADLAEEVERCLVQRRPLLENENVVVQSTLARGLNVKVDRGLLQSVLGNLIENAVKYSDGAPRVELVVTREDARAQLTVRDHGVGFAPELSGRLFERFFRGDAEQDQSRPGLGLGLYLVGEIVRSFGGDVAARSAGPGRGAEFIVSLPILPMSVVGSGAAPAAAPAEARP